MLLFFEQIMFFENPITALIALPTKRLNSMPNGYKNGPNLKIVFAAWLS